jgi:aldose 1-epimerase
MSAAGDLVWLKSSTQELALLPHLGGGIAAWRWRLPDGEFDVWRPWDGFSEDCYKVASFPLVPWSNRISHGGFEHAGRWYPMRPNRAGEHYPIHGDGCLQRWQLSHLGEREALLSLSSRHYNQAPYAYDASQRLVLLVDGLEQTLSVTNRGEAPLPFGLGLHPWFTRTPRARLQAPVNGMWLSGADPIPTRHVEDLAPAYDLNNGVAMAGGPLIDHCFTGWTGTARITWPDVGLALDVHAAPVAVPAGSLPPHYCIVYRPPTGQVFCIEPITHPIDAFHLPGRPGLAELGPGETMTLCVSWRVSADQTPIPASTQPDS